MINKIFLVTWIQLAKVERVSYFYIETKFAFVTQHIILANIQSKCTSVICFVTDLNQIAADNQLLQLCTARTAWSDSVY